MSQFSFESDVSRLLKLDAPISSGPQPRWQRKAASANTSTVGSLGMPAPPGAHNSSNNNSSMSVSPMKGTSRTNSTSRTPGRTPTSKCQNTPGAKGKSSPAVCAQTPGRAPRTPHGKFCDRFIPVRNSKNMEVASYLVSREETASPLKEKQAAMMHLLSGVDVEKARILRYQGPAPPVPEGYSNTQKVLYSQQGYTPLSLLKKKRHIPTQPERVLDAPAVRNDFYLNPLDWSVDNVVCVALGQFGTYLWDAETGNVTQHMKMEGQDYPSSVSWVPTGGNIIAIGTSFKTVQIWDVERNKCLRNMQGHSGRVSSLSWNGHLLSSGSRSGQIHHHDVRMVQHHVATLSGHSQEVCGLAWSPGGRLLASGSNDNNLLVWANGTTSSAPLHSLQQHTAAVKALAWCPWQASLLASGGGTNDHHIRLWNINTGICFNAVDAKSQVCSVLWSSEHKELLSAHGYAKNQLTLWAYPAMVPIAELLGHTERVLQVVASPDGSSVMSVGADESLRLWRCFQGDESRKKKKQQQLGGTNTGRLSQNCLR
ncbi:cell division cycle protein 20 homolog isoform X1 [Petromyzon marinus]|uniref:cell division cycle protein 20 homolog isoform X1 n=1 Tax=Petromyzon marinus TaxID=7757 RepID=UPI003F6F3F74